MPVAGCMTAQEYIESHLERSKINNGTNISRYVELPIIPLFSWCTEEQKPDLVHSKYMDSSLLQQTEINNRMNNLKDVKRSMKPFFLWYLKRRKKSSLGQDQEELTRFQVFKQLYAEWKLLSAEEKQPFIDESTRQKNQHRRISPNHYRGYQIKPNPPVTKNDDPTVVPLSFQDSVPKSSAQPTNQPLGLSPYLRPNLNAPNFMPYSPLYASGAKQSNTLSSYVPTYGKHSTSYPAALHGSNPRCAPSQPFTSMAAHNAYSQPVPPCRNKFMSSCQTPWGREFNRSEVEIEFLSSRSCLKREIYFKREIERTYCSTSSSFLAHHSNLELKQQNERSKTLYNMGQQYPVQYFGSQISYI